jgi:hypothetical protein
MSLVKTTARVRQTSRRQVAAISARLAGTCAAVLREHLLRLRGVGDHPNRVLHYDQLLAAHLVGFYDSVVRSLRTLDTRTVTDASMRQTLDELRLARSTISDAMAELPAAALLPLMRELLKRLPGDCSNPELADLVTLKRRICAIDGSYFRVPADVLWALAHTRRNGRHARQVRLDLHLEGPRRCIAGVPVLRFVPTQAQVDGKSRGSESAAFVGTLESGVVYLADRNFVDYDFLRAVIGLESDFVVRLKSSTNVVVVSAVRELSTRDTEAGVLEDQQVTVPGSRWTEGLPADVPLRLVTVFDPVRQEQVRLLTTLTEVPACIIGQLYRHRWAIELFFRWLKCVAKVKHLFSESANGITMQFYIMIIATLLMYLHTGSRPSVYSFVMLGSAASGNLVLEKVPEALERIAREREQERLRRMRAKKKNKA